ncbi:MocR-like pyridoxine biosynthesis transcription factor PdxR [Pseudoduganella sp. RAF53_2]|uniref:MocR-like pyridoxine biosynthesis transcription factor PdxR n=1 Tax=unclassified Pseudoduganella TaxID=2637179 RepID=UPI003F970547
MELHITIEGRKDLAGQVYRQLSDAIRSGRLADGQQLPPTRLLAEQLGVSRKTVAEAYSRLTLDKLLEGRIGAGSFVRTPAEPRLQRTVTPALASADILQKWEKLHTPLRVTPEGRSRFDFIGGRGTQSHFPAEEWRRCLLYALRQESEKRGLYSQTEGLPILREAIARHVSFARGVRADGGNVMVTSGAQQALDLLSRLLLEPGSVVAMEDPGYPAARGLFAAQGARIASVPVDDEGMVVEHIPADARLIYVTPAHQLPLGMPMSVARREALLARAAQIGAVIIEDDYDSEFRYEGRPTDSLQSMDTQGLVAFVGTFSKVLLPELRLGYVVLPPALRNAALKAKYLLDCHPNTLTQHALAKFIEDGYLLKHIRRSHGIYATRRERLMRLFADELSPWFRAVPVTAGFHISALAEPGVDVEMLIRLAHRAEVGLHSLADFYTEMPPRQGLFMGYGAIDVMDIETALLRVRDILLQLDEAAGQ